MEIEVAQRWTLVANPMTRGCGQNKITNHKRKTWLEHVLVLKAAVGMTRVRKAVKTSFHFDLTACSRLTRVQSLIVGDIRLSHKLRNTDQRASVRVGTKYDNL